MKKEKAEKKEATKEAEAKKPPTGTDLLALKLAAQAKLITKMKVEGGLAKDVKPPDFYPTGLEVFDKEVIGIGGLPKGRIVELYGPKSAGKSAVAMYLAAKVQRLDPSITVKLYDHENSFTAQWGAALGLDLDRTTVVQTMTAETMASMIQADLSEKDPESGVSLAPNIIIIDSLAVLQPQDTMEKEVEDLNMRDNMGLASFLTKFLNKLTYGWYWPPKDSKGVLPKGSLLTKLGQTHTCILATNHAKERTKSAGGKTWVEWYHVGGVAMDFHSCLQMMIKRIGFEEGADGNVSHQKINIKADKNKVAPPKRECNVLLSFAGGMEQIGIVDYLSMAVTKGLATVEGAWITSALLPKGKMQGREAFNKFVDSNKEVRKVFIS